MADVTGAVGRGLRKLGMWTKVGLLNAYGPADLPPDQNPVQQTKEEHGAVQDLQEMVDPQQGLPADPPTVENERLDRIAEVERERQARAQEFDTRPPAGAAGGSALAPGGAAPGEGALRADLHRDVQLGVGQEPHGTR